MPIALLDAATHSGRKTGGSGANTMVYTVSVGTDTILLVGISARDLNGRTVSSMTWNGAAMTAVPSSRLVHSGGEVWIQWFYIVNPTPASAQNISVTLSGDVAVSFNFGAISFSGVHQSTPFDATAVTAQGANSNATADIVTATDGAQVLAAMLANFNLSVVAGLTEIWQLNNSTDNHVAAAERTNKAVAGSQTATWTNADVGVWVESVIALKPSSGGGSGIAPATIRPRFVGQQGGPRKTKSNDRSDRTGGARR